MPFLKLLRGEKIERAVWTADLTYWMEGQRAAGRWDPAWDAEEGWLEFHRGLGVMPYFHYGKFWAGVPRYDETVSESRETHGDRTLHRIRTPLGEISEEHVYLAASACSACVKHFIATERELDILLYILERRRMEPTNLDDYACRLAAWAEYEGVPILGLPRSPLSALCVEWAGIQNAVLLLADCEEKVGHAFALMEEQETPVLEAVCDLGPPLVHFPDNLDSENLTSLYDRFLAGTHRRRIDRLHAAGIACAVHLDGAVRGLLPKLCAAGFDAVEALTPKPAGDLDVTEMRGVAGSDRVVLWGGVPGVLFAPPYQWSDMEAHIECLLAAWQGQRFVVGVADQVPPDGDVSFCRRIADRIAS